ncbi:isocitrate lyase/phosphoenolpyruvate mutase family protein [Pluralibacter gergoviae]
MDFKALHYQKKPLLLANVWDVPGALAAQEAGYQALGTSSAAVAAMMGYDDGENIPFDLLLFIVERIRQAVDLPLSVDIEAGFGTNIDDIINNVRRLEKTGAAGVNIEDSVIVNGSRQLEDPEHFCEKLRAVRQACPMLFINARTDTFLLKRDNSLAETLSRGKAYAESGADCLFVPGINDKHDISTVALTVNLPLNAMCIPGLADFDRLTEWGVKRISMGNFIHAALLGELKVILGQIKLQNSFSSIFKHENH